MLAAVATAPVLILTLSYLPSPQCGFAASWGRTDSLPAAPLEQQEAAPSGLPVLCYHHISSNPMESYNVSPTRFGDHLEALEEAGFFLIGPEDILDGLRSVPEDRHPVMLSFDDGWQDNMSLIRAPDGSLSIDPCCAAAILRRFCDLHPDFGRAAVFFISWDKVPFGQESLVAEKMNMLLDMGFTIGNHTLRHTPYGILPADRWESATVEPLRRFRDRLGLRALDISTLAYPGGWFPDASWARESISSFDFMGRKAVQLGFLVNGEIARLSSVSGTRWGRFYIGRIDMSRYRISDVIASRSLVAIAGSRDDLHDPLRYRPLPMSDRAQSF
ncbi:hypothetical protein JW921_11680 [Candidatus Fermentibacterales bacterium]|nr:hypothetical protein [Candidatus Fermentibacterales bacterium]